MGNIQKRPVHFYKGISLDDMPDKAKERADDLLQQVSDGERPILPFSRPMPKIGPRCHEIRIKYKKVIWRLVYRTDTLVILVVDLFKKKTEKTPNYIIRRCKKRLAEYDELMRRRKK